MKDQKGLRNFDFFLLILTLILLVAGLINLYSATYNHPSGGPSSIFFRQIYWTLIGVFVLLVFSFFDYHLLENYSYQIYVLTIALLILVLIAGKTVGGARRWIGMGSFTIQPSEFAKLSVILVLSRYFSQRPNPYGHGFLDIIPPLILTAIPSLLILLQPDLGTSALLMIVGFSLFVYAGLRFYPLLFMTVAGTLSTPIMWEFLKDYQKKRIIHFLNPESDPLGAGYHLLQSKIAIGSGKIIGKGFMEGKQGQLHFLPEGHTDFIFSVFAEEWGFLGSVVLLCIIAMIIIKGFLIAAGARDRFGTYLAASISFYFLWHSAINIAMVTGLIPVVGIPLPFMSYGGSFLITVMASMGILINISMKRYIF
ncbi:MAG: rod shape-determining protein RodA [Candidatus Aenigmatarchaeota archaeon]